MRILFILEYYHPHIGGLETLFKTLIDALSQQGHQITVVTNRYQKNLPSEERSGTVLIKRYPFVNRYLFTILAFFPAFRQALKHDVIHTTSYNAGFPALLAGLLSGKRVVISFHEVWGDMWMQLPHFSKWKLKLHQLFERVLLKLPFHTFIAVSHATAVSLQKAGVASSRIKTIHNGVDYAAFETWQRNQNPSQEDRPFHFIYFGRLGISKGLDILIPALHLLKQVNPLFKMVLVVPKQPDDLYSWVLKSIDGLDEQVELKHDLEKNALLDLVSQSDAVVIPSYSEGFCFTAVESMALDVPIISSQRGALKEVVGGKYLAFDDFSARGLADAMRKAMNDQWQTKPKQRFPLDQSVEGYCQLYSELLLT